MSDSFKEITGSEVLPFPTILDLPSSTSLSLSLAQVDQKLSSMTMDVYNMCKFATELKQVDFFRNYGVRQLGLIRCIVQNFGANCYYYPKLITCLRACNSKWKRLLFRNIRLICKDPKPEEIFIYKAERNTYFLSMLRTINTNIKKIIEQFLARNLLNLQTKKYLKSQGIMKHYNNLWLKMLEVMQQKQEETYLKIYLIEEFIKYLLYCAYFCCSEKEESEVFHRFEIASLYLCRIIKKFYCQDINTLIQDSLSTIMEGLQLYLETLCKNDKNYVKMDQIKLIIGLIHGKKVSYQDSLLNQNSFVIRLILKILFNWRHHHNRSQKIKSFNHSNSNHELRITTLIKNQKVKAIRNHLCEPKNFDLEEENQKIGRSLVKLNRKKSISSKNLVIGSHTMGSPNYPVSNVKIRTQIEGYANRYFSRANSLTFSLGKSRERKRENKKVINDEQKQLKLEDYTIFFSNKTRVVPTLNKIQLYRPDKMQNYYPSKPKGKLKLK